jgi:tetratricopeptide (TPR) repeat protein
MNKNPETRSGGIVDQLQFHREGRTVPDDFSLAKIKREIDSLIKVDSSTGYMVKGILYSLIGEADKSIENHNKSLLLAFRVDSYENYFTSLIALNKFPEAYKLAIDAIKKSPGLPKFLEQGIRAAYRVGRLAEMMELYQQYTKVMSHQEQKKIFFL